MSIHQTKDGRWFAVYWDGPRQMRKYFGRETGAKKAAEAYDHQVKSWKAEGRRVTNRPQSPPLAYVTQKYLEFKDQDLSPRTIYDINKVFNRYVLPQIGQIPCHELTQQDLTALMETISAGGTSAKTVNRYCQYLMAVLNWAIKGGHIKKNPLQLIRLKEKRYTPELPSIVEFLNILSHAPEHLRWALEVEYNTGCRPGPSELFALKWDMIDWTMGIIRIYNPKTDRVIIKPLKKLFLERLKKRYAGKTSDYIIDYKGRPLKRVKTAWSTAKQKAGITKRIRLYDIRHLYATLMLMAGGDIKGISNLLGHSSIKMTLETYYQIAESFKNQQIDFLPDLVMPQINADCANLKNKK